MTSRQQNTDSSHAAGTTDAGMQRSSPQRNEATQCERTRRMLLQAGMAFTAAGLVPARGQARPEGHGDGHIIQADAEDDPKRTMRPQIGDLLIPVESDQPVPIKPGDLKLGAPPVLAWAFDPATKQPRDGSRLNQVLLLRLDPAQLGPTTKQHAAEGVVAYSAICTHAQCPVTGWIEDRQVLHCPCHQSEYDPKHDAAVVGGPAPRALAALPLKVGDGRLEVAGSFIGKVGMNQPTM